MTYGHGRLTMFGGGFMRFYRRGSDSYSLRQNLAVDPVTFLEQEGSSTRRGRSASADLTTELKVSERATLWAEGRVDRQASDVDGLTAYTQMDESQLPVLLYDRATLRDSHDLSADLSAGYRHVLQPDRHELELQLRWEPERNGNDRESRRLLRTLEGEYADLPVERTLDEGDLAESGISGKVDYVRPWGEKGQMEMGYRGELDDRNDGQLRQVFPDVGADDPLSATDLGFSHRELFNSAYLTLSRRLGRLSAQGGVRAERADTRLTLPSTGESYVHDYASLFPSAHLAYDFEGGRRMRLSYSRRIRRPRAWILNPIDRSTDPLNREVGNPDIDPQYTNSLSLEMQLGRPARHAAPLPVLPAHRRRLGAYQAPWTNRASPP